MHEPWVAYVVVGAVTAFMMLGKKMIFFDDSNKEDKEDKNDKS